MSFTDASSSTSAIVVSSVANYDMTLLFNDDPLLGTAYHLFGSSQFYGFFFRCNL